MSLKQRFVDNAETIPPISSVFVVGNLLSDPDTELEGDKTNKI